MQSFFYTHQYYTMDGRSDLWKVAYYPVTECGKSGEVYAEPRALVETPINNEFGKPIGADLREVPVRYLEPINRSSTGGKQ